MLFFLVSGLVYINSDSWPGFYLPVSSVGLLPFCLAEVFQQFEPARTPAKAFN